MCVNNLPRVALDSEVAGIWTHELLIASPVFYRYATEPHVYMLSVFKYWTNCLMWYLNAVVIGFFK